MVDLPDTMVELAPSAGNKKSGRMRTRQGGSQGTTSHGVLRAGAGGQADLCGARTPRYHNDNDNDRSAEEASKGSNTIEQSEGAQC